jgi:hypothetical protein
MPGTVRQQAALRQKALENECGWAGDWERITGEPYSVEANIRRVHPDDIRRLWAAVARSIRTGRFEVEYHLLNRRGKYVLVHGVAWQVGNAWPGIIEVIGDEPWPLVSHCIITSKRERK